MRGGGKIRQPSGAWLNDLYENLGELSKDASSLRRSLRAKSASVQKGKMVDFAWLLLNTSILLLEVMDDKRCQKAADHTFSAVKEIEESPLFMEDVA